MAEWRWLQRGPHVIVAEEARHIHIWRGSQPPDGLHGFFSRHLRRSMDLTGVLSNQHSCDKHKLMTELRWSLTSPDIVSTLTHLAKKLDGVKAGGVNRSKPVPQRQRLRRPGWVVKAITQVLLDRAEPMRARDIHKAVEESLGEKVRWGSTKQALSSHVSGTKPKFIRVARGRYLLADN